MLLKKILKLYNEQNFINKEKKKYINLFIKNYTALTQKYPYIANIINKKITNIEINKNTHIDHKIIKNINKIIKNNSSEKIIFIDNQLYNQFNNSNVVSILNLINQPIQNKYYNTITNHNIFNIINISFIEKINILHVKKTNQYINPLELYYFYSNDNCFYNTRNIIIIENNKTKIIEKYHSLNKQPLILHNIINEIFIKKNSKLEYYKIQNNNKNSIILDNTFIQQYDHSFCKLYTFSLKNQLLLNNIYVKQSGEKSHTTIKNISIPKINNQIIQHNTIIHHEKSYCKSEEIYKSIIKNKINFNFYGKIIINANITKINAYQQNNNIILSDNSQIHVKPELDIKSNNVKCSHGCTISRVDNDIIFYMRTRGFRNTTAKKVFINAFLYDITNTITPPALKQEIIKYIS